jgi:hypothetical protein
VSISTCRTIAFSILCTWTGNIQLSRLLDHVHTYSILLHRSCTESYLILPFRYGSGPAHYY